MIFSRREETRFGDLLFGKLARAARTFGRVIIIAIRIYAIRFVLDKENIRCTGMDDNLSREERNDVIDMLLDTI